MTRIGCRAHDYGKLPATALAATLRAKGYNAAQLAMPRAIAGIEDFSHITDKQLAEIRTAFAAQDVEISVLSCYQDLSAPDADARRAAMLRLARFGSRFKALAGNFQDVESILSQQGVSRVDGLLAVSYTHLTLPTKLEV